MIRLLAAALAFAVFAAPLAAFAGKSNAPNSGIHPNRAVNFRLAPQSYDGTWDPMYYSNCLPWSPKLRKWVWVCGPAIPAGLPAFQVTEDEWRLASFTAMIGLGKWSGRISMSENHRITLAPEVLAGKPIIRGTRLSVEFVIRLMADGWSEAAIIEHYPGVSREDVIACLAYARDA